MTEYTKLLPRQDGGYSKFGLREIGYTGAQAPRQVEPHILANASVLCPTRMNTRALVATCGAAWAVGLQQDATLMWHSFLDGLGRSQPFSCPPVTLLPP